MSEYGFSLARIFPYKGRIADSVLIRENKGQRKPVFWYILRSDVYNVSKARGEETLDSDLLLFEKPY